MLCIQQVLITTARTVGGPAYLKTIEEMERELTEVIEDFNRAVNVEALHRIKETGMYLLSRCGNSSFSKISYRARASAEAPQTRRDEL